MSQFVVLDSESGYIGYTKTATGVGTEALRRCHEMGVTLANRTGRAQWVYLTLRKLRVGETLNPAVARFYGISEVIEPTGGNT